jgi:hypothetical protein
MAEETSPEKIAESAAQPKSAASDGVSVTQHSLREQIESDKYRRATSAASNPLGAIKRVRVVPPGTV